MAGNKVVRPVENKQWSSRQQRLKDFLPPRRYEHCLRVSEEACLLARCHGIDEERARLAGLLHDVARDLSPDALFANAARFGLTVGPDEYADPVILHAAVGAKLLKNEWGINDKAVLRAVEEHTLAAPDMDKLCQIIYLADIIEPGRREWPGLNALRKLCYEHLGRAMLLALKESIGYLKESRIRIHPRTLAAYDFWARQLVQEESAKKN
ncbi:MAG: bis(5'-nucleosyl)-tetraphosphatase (symmetrical) YqeK [Clostridiales bacterium]|nr:bis(5'-nucleosyl)-tetraphosphatase (symmetrical) YqeK [Clostridiales bacterium]